MQFICIPDQLLKSILGKTRLDKVSSLDCETLMCKIRRRRQRRKEGWSWKEVAVLSVQLTHGAKVEELGKFSPVGETGIGLAQLIEESMCAGLQRWETRHRCVLQQTRAQWDGFRRSSRLKHLTNATVALFSNLRWKKFFKMNFFGGKKIL